MLRNTLNERGRERESSPSSLQIKQIVNVCVGDRCTCTANNSSGSRLVGRHLCSRIVFFMSKIVSTLTVINFVSIFTTYPFTESIFPEMFVMNNFCEVDVFLYQTSVPSMVYLLAIIDIVLLYNLNYMDVSTGEVILYVS